MKLVIVLAGTPQPQEALDHVLAVARPALAGADLQVWLPDARLDSLGLPPELDAQIIASGLPLMPDAMVDWLEGLYRQQAPDLLLFCGGDGHQLAARLSVRAGCGCFPDVHTIAEEGERLALVRKTCGSHLDWMHPWDGTPLTATVTPGRAAAPAALRQVSVQTVPPAQMAQPQWLLGREVLEAPKVNPLETAPRLLIGGRGLGSRAACDQLRQVARLRGFVPGYTRPVAMNGWCGLEEIVGQSGTRTSAELCITLGVSGAAALLAGIAGAKTLVAVNTDPNAPIFRHAQVGILADAPGFLQELLTLSGGAT